MKILWISPALPYPPDNGLKVRIFNLISPLSQYHDISLVSFVDTKEPQEENISHLSKYCTTVRSVPFQPEGAKGYGLFNRLPDVVLVYFSSSMVKAIKEEISKRDFDIIIIESLKMAQYLPADFKGLSTLSTHNVESIKYRSLLELKKGIKKKTGALIQLSKLRRYEINMLNEFDLCITVSERDRYVFQKWSSHRNMEIEEIPIGIDTAEYKPIEDEKKDGKTISFCGACSYEPNVDAILYFYKEILPIIKYEIPDVTFQVIGSNPPTEILNLASEDNITVTGYVDDVKTYLLKSSVFAAPLRMGGGSKVKIIQAMGSGLPVVTTPEGARGIHATPGKDLLVADNSRGFAQHVISLLQNEDLRTSISKSARECIVARYDMDVVAGNYTLVMEKLVAQKCLEQKEN